MASVAELGPELPAIARAAIAAWLAGERHEPSSPGAPRAPVFVTLRAPGGALRGCIGTTAPATPDLVAETARSAVLAASRDPRFPRVTAEELSALRVEVSVLLPEEPVSGPGDLDPARYGVIVRGADGRQGLLLPEVPGIDDVETQLGVARAKGGLAPDAPARLTRFEVLKFVG